MNRVATAPSFEELYDVLAAVLAGSGGGAVKAAPTPLGRGLVAVQPVPEGFTLLSGVQVAWYAVRGGQRWSGRTANGRTCRHPLGEQADRQAG